MKEKKRDGGGRKEGERREKIVRRKERKRQKARKKDGEREGNRREGARNKVASSHSKHESLTPFFYLYSIYEVKLIWLPKI